MQKFQILRLGLKLIIKQQTILIILKVTKLNQLFSQKIQIKKLNEIFKEHLKYYIIIMAFNEKIFIQKISQLELSVNSQNKKILGIYQQYLIPFEQSMRTNILRVSNNNEKQKIELLKKFEQLQRSYDTLQQINNQKNQTIERLQFQILNKKQQINNIRQIKQQMQTNMNQLFHILQDKVKTINTLRQQKLSLTKQLELLTNKYNKLAFQIDREKTLLRQQSHKLVQIESKLNQRQNKIQQNKFYLETEKKNLYAQKKKIVGQLKNLKQSVDISIKPDLKPKLQRIVIPQIFQDQLIRDQSQQKNIFKGLARKPIKKIFKHHLSQIYCLATSYNGNSIISCGGDRFIKIYDPINLKLLNIIQTNSPQSIFITLQANSHGDNILAGSTDRGVYLYNSYSSKLLRSFIGHGQKINTVSFTNSKEKCVSGSDDRQIKLWDIQLGSNIHSISCGKSVKVVVSNNAESIIYSGHGDGSIRSYSTIQGKTPVNQIRGLIDYPITSITLSSSNKISIVDRNKILVGSKQGSIINLIDLRTNKILKKFQDQDFYNSSDHFNVEYNLHQSHIVAGTFDGNLIYWNVNSAKKQLKLTGHEGSVTSVKFNPFTQILASADSKGNLILWN